MTVKRFKILQALHVNDNSKAPKQGETGYDKLYKWRPLINKLNRKFQYQCITTSSQSVDEAMILFKGRSSLKQYMPMKPIKCGYKAWVRADSTTGNVFQFEMYVGKQDSDLVEVGLGERVVKRPCQQLEFKEVRVAFDNFFESPSLMENLKAK